MSFFHMLSAESASHLQVGKRLIVINFGLQKYEDWDDRSRQPEHGTRSCPPPPSFDSVKIRLHRIHSQSPLCFHAFLGSDLWILKVRAHLQMVFVNIS